MTTNSMKLKRQVETNTRRMRMLMIMVEQDIRRRSQNAQDIDDWMEKLSPFIHEDVFVTGIYSAKMAAIISKIASAVTISSLPKGMNQSVTKGIISECCYTYVRGATREMQTEMQKFAIECYNNKMTAVEIGEALGQRFSDLTKARCQAIARTETMRASNLANLVQARNRGATGYTVFCNKGACTHCIEEYGKHEDTVYEIGDTVNFPPLHPNCRCTPAFIYSPLGDDVKKSTQNATPVTPKAPTEEQLKSNLTKEELAQVKWAKDVQTSEFISETGKAKARETLNKLYEKALGNPVNNTVKKPKTTVEEPITKPKTNSIENMSSQDLYESMTKADKKKYDKFKKKVETADKNIKQLGENPILLDMKKKNLMELRKLEQKQRTKLENKGKRKPKTEPVRTNERTLDNIHKEVEVPTDELIPQLEKWIDKRCKNTSEFGYQFDVETGKIIDGLKDGEIRGKKGGITMSDLGIKTGSIHSHPRNGMSAPSIEDLEVFRCKKQQHHFMVSEHEIWYVKATDNFGIGGMGQQLDLQSAHKACRDRAFETVSKLVKKGKIEATEEALAKALDKYTGDEILKTFNKPPWNKTMTVKRYYR